MRCSGHGREQSGDGLSPSSAAHHTLGHGSELRDSQGTMVSSAWTQTVLGH